MPAAVLQYPSLPVNSSQLLALRLAALNRTHILYDQYADLTAIGPCHSLIFRCSGGGGGGGGGGGDSEAAKKLGQQVLSLKQELQKAEAAVEQLTAERDTAQSSMAKLQAKCAQLQEQVAKVLECTRHSLHTYQ